MREERPSERPRRRLKDSVNGIAGSNWSGIGILAYDKNRLLLPVLTAKSLKGL